jgi:LmbE family N-acetylglucosaminyl deacetylase
MYSGPRKFLPFLFLLLLSAPAWAQRDLAGAAENRLSIEKLRVLGSVLMIGAHPDDENTALLAYFARGKKYRTAYLSLTRGEGGQNLIGPEQGALLGLIRTQELLAARRIDGAEQFFTRAIDFGFSKSADETMTKWGHDEILSDVVSVIRKFQPDVVILRFTGTSRDGHGHHQASAILGKEAFFAAGDRRQFPEQLKYVQPWQAKRLLWNAFSFTPQQEQEAHNAPARIDFDPGEYDPVLGYSYAEIAGMSRSMHRSQGMGAPERKGSTKQYLIHVAGDPAAKDVFDGVDTTWGRVEGGTAAGPILMRAAQSFEDEHPEKVVPTLFEARRVIHGLKGPWADLKRNDLEETITRCAGLWVEATADRWDFVPGAELRVRGTVLIRSQLRARGPRISSVSNGSASGDELVKNNPAFLSLSWKILSNTPLSQPYWLTQPTQYDRYTVTDQTLIGQPENAPLSNITFGVSLEGEQVDLTRPVIYRYVDKVEGERTRALAIVPAVALDVPQRVLLFPDANSRNIELDVRSNGAAGTGEAGANAPPGWRLEPATASVQIPEAGEQVSVSLTASPPKTLGRGSLKFFARSAGTNSTNGMTVISYPHIPPQVVFPATTAELVRVDVKTLAREVGYVMGAGDEMPEALRQLGCRVTLLGPNELATGDLSRFDAIVTGVRAYNVRADLRENQQRLLDYVLGGGTLIVQYNVLDNPQQLSKIGPYPIRIGRDRVTVEEAPVSFPDPSSPLLKIPNEITEADFKGWVQERGLYFASDWDPRYKPLLESHDSGEPPHPGGMLYTKYGKGAYVFTAYSWFRQLPAGVPGAYRVFANLLSAGKAHP